ncbi:hypothetical protein EH31_14455 [Erythrobacter longus]|uniref:Uncharacterized protein n=1 Tax=Erythrobacter longus TaxID=1044 RepID=A0A074MBK1_ERYLO|nr:hypothetical protein [Erythrobacter longus]KEO89228.1 hypothetical protein EH31_14455 [Erythrobacter longus]
MASQHPANPYSFAHEVQAHDSVAFQCSQDVRANPWLALPVHHPVVVQTQSFWTAVGASSALQGWEETKWTALTWIDWELGEADGGHATRGFYRLESEEGKLGYVIELFNADGAVVVTIRGRGVIFRNRNFEQWREEAKKVAQQSVQQSALSTAFQYAEPKTLGLAQGERVFVAPFDLAKGYIEALVTAENGFPPGNAFIGGSGDHVNSTHLHELARQALFLVKGRTDIDTSGEMTMKRYVELGAPLRLNVARVDENSAIFEVEQVGNPCASITLRF